MTPPPPVTIETSRPRPTLTVHNDAHAAQVTVADVSTGDSVATADTVWLDWQDIPGADDYTITRTRPDSAEPRQLGTTVQSQFVDTTAEAEQRYGYIVETEAATAAGMSIPTAAELG